MTERTIPILPTRSIDETLAFYGRSERWAP
jgi:hypothetical protein